MASAIAMRFFHPGICAEFVLARALNFVLFAAALYAFSRFWRAVAEWSKHIDDHETSIPVASPFAWILFGYLLFIVNFAWSVDSVNPDILVAAIVFAIAAFLFKLHDFRLNDRLQPGLALMHGSACCSPLVITRRPSCCILRSLSWPRL